MVSDLQPKSEAIYRAIDGKLELPPASGHRCAGIGRWDPQSETFTRH